MSEYDNEDVWKHFKRGTLDKDRATCTHCAKSLACKASSTTGLHRHLTSVHNMKRKLKESSTCAVSEPTTKKIKRIGEYFTTSDKSLTLARIVSKLAAKDGISINAISKSSFIRESLQLQGFSLPKNPSDVMNLIFKFHDTVKNQIISKINQMKAANKKFSISIDEWTSFRNRRYLNVHLYFSDRSTENLGLMRIEGSCPADKAIEMVTSKIRSFDLNYETDIVSTTSDGASIMLKYGRLSPAFQQLCYNHAIHLAVMKVFYEKKVSSCNNLSDEVVNEDSDNDDFESDDLIENEFVADNIQINCSMQIKKTIIKIRGIVKLFKNSPVRNSILQSNIKEMISDAHELQLLLDCKTRWNTIESITERFLKLKPAILKTLSDLNLGRLWDPKTDDVVASNIFNSLTPVKKSIEALSCQDASLLSAEGILKFLVKSLQTNNSEISRKLLSEIKNQIFKRRDNLIFHY